jgi:hypothetical protein
MNLQYTILLYIILLSMIYLWKPNIFQLNNNKITKRKKLYYLIFLIIIISIISFYIKVLSEWFL